MQVTITKEHETVCRENILFKEAKRRYNGEIYYNENDCFEKAVCRYTVDFDIHGLDKAIVTAGSSGIVFEIMEEFFKNVLNIYDESVKTKNDCLKNLMVAYDKDVKTAGKFSFSVEILQEMNPSYKFQVLFTNKDSSSLSHHYRAGDTVFVAEKPNYQPTCTEKVKAETNEMAKHIVIKKYSYGNPFIYIYNGIGKYIITIENNYLWCFCNSSEGKKFSLEENQAFWITKEGTLIPIENTDNAPAFSKEIRIRDGKLITRLPNWEMAIKDERTDENLKGWLIPAEVL